MADSRASLPVKTTEIETFWIDSRIWNDFQFRQGDIIIDTFPKCGTTWIQQIVGQLIFNGEPAVDIKCISPWLDCRFNKDRFGSDEALLRTIASQPHRRFIKTHLPLDALVFSSEAKYLIVGRDGRDVACSMHHHLASTTIEGVRRPETIEEIFRMEILSTSPISFFTHVRSWWAQRHLPNVLLVHFAQLKRDLGKEIRRIAAFLEMDIDPTRWDDILEHCSFTYMKKHAEQTVEKKDFIGGAQTFFCQGTNDRWKGVLSDEDSSTYERRAVEELGEDGARWLRTGELTDECLSKTFLSSE